VAWGLNNYGQTNVPVGLSNVVGIAAGDYHSVALKENGTVVAWGRNGEGQTNVPTDLTNAVSISAGWYFSVALKEDGTAVGWGRNDFGEASVPEGLSNVMELVAGGDHCLALKEDGTVVSWGRDWEGQTEIPEGLTNVVAVAGGGIHSLALKDDGTVVAWGANNQGQVTVPEGLTNVAAIAAGNYHSLALQDDGMVVESLIQKYVPTASSQVESLLSQGIRDPGLYSGAPLLQAQGDDETVGWGGTVRFVATASGARPLNYQWRLNGTNIDGATNAWLTLSDVRGNQAGAYSVVVSNAFGSTISFQGALAIKPSFAKSQSGSTLSNGKFHLTVGGVEGTPFILESSSNLIQWTPVLTNTFTADGLPLALPASAQQQYFRMRVP
jgi:hypothetical protein